MGSWYSTVAEVRSVLRAELKLAMKAKETAAVKALRSALAAIDNAEAVTVADEGPAAVVGEHIAGGGVGLGAGEGTRRELAVAEVRQLLRDEIGERLSAAEQHEAVGRNTTAQQLRAEADVLQRYLGS